MLDADPWNAATVNGSISTPGETDIYRFTVDAKTTYYFDTLINDGRLRWSLTGPNGLIVDHRSFTGSDGPNISDPTVTLVPGDYRLSIDGDGDMTGPYSFRFAAITLATPIAFDNEITGQLDPANETDLYSFVAAEGDQFRFELVSGSNLGSARVRIIDPYGHEVLDTYVPSTGGATNTLSAGRAPGTYTVLVEGYRANVGTGDYTFRIAKTGNVPPSPFSGTALSLGTVVNGTTPEGGGSVDYTFALTSDQLLMMDVRTHDTDLRWSLRGPSGTVVDNRYFHNTDSVDGTSVLDLPAGEYQLSVYSPNRDSFQFLLGELGTLASPIALDTEIADNISAAASAAYQFDLVKGQRYFFDALTNSGFSTTAYWSLYDPNGRRVFRDQIHDNQERTARFSGTYTLLVEARYYERNGGTYSFNVRSISDTSQPYTIGDTISQTLAVGQRQRYTFDLSEPTRLMFDSLSNTSLLWSLDGPLGRVVSERRFNDSDSYDEWPVLELAAGSYTLTVDGSGDDAGNFSWRLLSAAQATPLTFDTDVTATHTPARSTQLFTFNAAAGDRFYFDYLSHSGYETNPYWRVIRPDGSQLFGDWNYRDRGPFTLPQSGTYWLAIEGRYYDDNPQGQTTFRVRSVTDVTEPMVLGETISAALDVGQVRRYTFSLAESKRLISDSLTDSLLDWSLDGPGGRYVDNRDLRNSDSANGWSHLALPAGDYTVTIDGRGDEAGAFAFRFLNADDATAITIGERVTTDNTPARGTHLFRFDAAAGDRVFFDHLGGSGWETSPYWRVIRPDGVELFTTADYNDRGPYTLPQSGTYLLAMEGRYYDDNPQGQTTFRIVAVSDEQSALTIGQPVLGTIEVGQRDTHTFNLAQPRRLYMDALLNNNRLGWTLVRRFEGVRDTLVDHRRFHNTDANDGYGVLDLPAGDYEVIVDGDGDARAQYAFRLLDLAHATPVTPNSLVTGDLGQPLGDAWHDGAPVTYPSGQSNGALSLDGATYAITPDLRNGFSDETVTLELWFNAEADGVILTELGSTTPQQSWHDSQIEILPSGEVKVRVWQLNPVSLGTVSFGQWHHVALRYDKPSRTLDGFLNGVKSATTVTGDRSAPWESGYPLHYALGAGDSTHMGSGKSFVGRIDEFRVWNIARGDAEVAADRDQPLNGDEPGLIAYYHLDDGTGTTAADATANAHDASVRGSGRTTDAYRFTATAGEVIYVDLRGYSGFNQTPHWRLIGPDAQVASNWLYNDAGPLTLLDDGQYTLLIEGRYHETSGGPYSFRIRPVTPQPVSLGSDVTIEAGDRLSFTLAADTLLYIDSLSDQSNLNYRLSGPTGTLVSRSLHVADAERNGGAVLKAKAGDYILDITGSHNGTASLRVLNLATADALAFGAPVDGSVTPARTTAAYRFTAASGDEVQLSVTYSDFSHVPRVKVVDIDGRVILDEYAYNNSGVWNLYLTRGGNYTVLVEGRVYDSAASGSFSVTATHTGNTPVEFTGTPLTLGSVVTGNLPTAGDSQSYTFTLTEPGRLYMDVLGGDTYLRWSLQGTAGSFVNGRYWHDSDSHEISGDPTISVPAGSYQLTIYDRAGDFTFAMHNLEDAATGTPLTLGTAVVDAQLDPSRETHLYRFSGSAGDRIYYDYLSRANSGSLGAWPELRLYGPDGRLLREQYFYDDFGPLTLPADGDYVLAVEGYRTGADGATVTYSFNLKSVTPQPLTIGQATTAEVGSEFSFTLADDAEIFFDSLTGKDFRWTLIGPGGTVISNRGFRNDGHFDLDTDPTLRLAAGDYVLRVTGPDNGEGNFRLVDLATAEMLTPGALVETQLDPGRQTDAYRFTASAGETLFFDGRSASNWTYTTPRVRLVAPDGRVLFRDQDVRNDNGPFAAPLTGTYTLFVEGSWRESDASVINYSFSLNKPITPSTSITIGDTVTGSIAAAGDTHRYTFTLNESTPVVFDALSGNSTGWRWHLDGPRGRVVDSREFRYSDSADYGSSSPVLNLPAGEYTVTIDPRDSLVGGYSFRLLDINAGQVIALGETVSGTLEPGRETDTFRFFADAGTRIFFDHTAISGQTYDYPYWRIIAPDGSQTRYERLGDTGPFTLGHSGTYTLLLEGRVHENAGSVISYGFALHNTNDKHGTVTVGETIVGTIDVPGQQVTYDLTLDADTTLYFDSLSNDPNAFWTLSGPNGTVVSDRRLRDSDASNFASNSSPLMNLPAGQYTLRLRKDGDRTGGFRYRLLDAASATPFIINSAQAATLNPARQSDLYRFAGTKGQRVFFNNITVSGTTYTNPFVRIIDPIGRQLTSFSFNDQEPIELPLDGDYLLIVEGYSRENADAVISYEFNLEQTDSGNDSELGELTIGVDDARVVEGDSGTTQLVFNVRLSRPHDTAVSVDYQTFDNTATAGSDYTAGGGTLTFAASETVKQVTVDVTGDVVDEPDELLELHLSNPSTGLRILDGVGIGTIDDDDDLPTLGIADVTVGESASQALFSVNLSGAAEHDVTVDWATADGSATEGRDYIAASGTLIIPAGHTSGTIAVDLLDDELDEFNETIRIDLSNVFGAVLADKRGIATVNDDDASPVVSVADAQVVEGNSGLTAMTFDVTLDRPSGRTTSVRLYTSDRSSGEVAKAGEDYQPTNQHVTFAPGETSKTVVVNVIGDTFEEADEQFNANLYSANYLGYGTSTAVGTIADDDAVVGISASNISVTEGDTGTRTVVFTLSLTAPPTSPVSVDWQTVDGDAVAGSDYTAANGTVTFDAGETSKTIEVQVLGDYEVEGDETFSIQLSNAVGGQIIDDTGVGTIDDDDYHSYFYVNNISLDEGDSGTTQATFTITLSPSAKLPASIDWATADGSALAGEDYTAASGTLTFAAGETSKTVTVNVAGDQIDETNETFGLVLTNASGALIGDGNGTATVRNDDTEPQISISDASVIEGDSGQGLLTFTVTLAPRSGKSVTVDFATRDGSATAGSDYVATNGTLTFEPGQTSKSISVFYNGDTDTEGDELLYVDLANATNATIADAEGAGTIVDDDGLPTLNIADAVATEGDSGTTPMSFTLTLSKPAAGTVTADWSTVALTGTGAARAGHDYESAGGTVTFAPGETSKTVEVAVIGDTRDEPDESFEVHLSNIRGSDVSDLRGVGTITDDDLPPGLSVADLSRAEGSGINNAVLFNVQLAQASNLPVTVRFRTVDGTAVAGEDYVGWSGTLYFAPGQTSYAVAVNVVGDTAVEPDETFSLELFDPTNASIDDAAGTATLVNDDSAGTFDFGAASYRVRESAGQAVVTVLRNGGNAGGISVDYSVTANTATAGDDFTPVNGTLNFKAGQQSATFTVPLVNDDLAETAEQLTLLLSNATGGASLGTRTQATLEIVDDDTPPGARVADVEVVEPQPGVAAEARFRVELEYAFRMPVTLSYATADGTALAGQDYAATAGTVTFQPGELIKVVAVPLLGDALAEPTEQFTLVLSNPVNATLTDPTGVARVRDSNLPGLSLSDPDTGATTGLSVSETSGTRQLRISRNTATDTQLAVRLQSDMPDRVVPPGVVVIPQGQSFIDIDVTVLHDGRPTGDYSALITATAEGMTTGSVDLTVHDEDHVELSVSLSAMTVTEGADPGSLFGTVTRAGDTSQALRVQLEDDAGDFVTVPFTIVIPAGEASASFPILIGDNDSATENPPVTIAAYLATPGNSAEIPGTRAEAMLTVASNDGDTLFLSSAAAVVGEGASVRMTVRRNTDTSGDLAVNLASSDPTQATVPATVVIPAGSETAEFFVTGVSDGTTDGDRSVTVTATAGGFAIGAKGIVVSDGDLPDLFVDSLSYDTTGLKSGGQITVTWTVRNGGVGPAAGDWQDRVYLSRSRALGDSAVLLAPISQSRTLQVGEAYTVTKTLRLPQVVGDFYVVVRTDDDGSHDDGTGLPLDGKIRELLPLNNAAAGEQVSLAPGYVASVQVNGNIFPAGAEIPVTGTAFNPDTGQPIKYEFVDVVLRDTRGFEREQRVLTEEDGSFGVTFKTLAQEGGDYTVAAAHPGVADPFATGSLAWRDAFTIIGFDAEPDRVSVSVTPAGPSTGAVSLRNLTQHALTGLSVQVVGAPADLTVDTTLADIIAGGESTSLSYSLSTSNGNLGNGKITFRITADGGVSVDVPVDVRVRPLLPVLQSSVSTLRSGMVRGESRLTEFTLTNTGTLETGALTVSLPPAAQAPFMKLVGPAQLESLAPGETATVTLKLSPAADLDLLLYTGSIAINSSSGAGLTVPYEFRAISTATGDVKVAVTDDYTYYVDGAPKVGGAQVKLIDPFSGALVAEGVTGANGEIDFRDIAEGSYYLEVRAEDHDSFRGVINVVPGVSGVAPGFTYDGQGGRAGAGAEGEEDMTNYEEVFVARKFVSYNWKVEPTVIEDSYSITLESQFQTEAPVPRVVIDDPFRIPLVFEDRWTQMNYTLRNVGLVAAENVRFDVPMDHELYEVQVLVDTIPMIPAQSEVVVPVRIKARTAALANQAALASAGAAAGSVPEEKCLPSLDFKVKYSYPCGPLTVEQGTGASASPICSFWECLADKVDPEFLKDTVDNLLKKDAGAIVCDIINAVIDCTPLSDCQKAGLKGIKGAVMGASGGVVGAVGGALSNSWKDLLECLCDLFKGISGSGGTPSSGGGFSGGGGGGGTYYAGGGSVSVSGPDNPCAAAGALGGEHDHGSGGQTTQDGAVCAEVRMRLEQSVAMTRNAFLGTLELNNGHTNIPLENVTVTLDIRDHEGNTPSNQVFATRVEKLVNLTGVDGSGVIPADTEGQAQFLFIPTREAAPDGPIDYWIGGTLSYTEAGVQVTVSLAPALITVHPDPNLQIHYFQQRDVFSDDPFTEEVEPAEPFSLGMMVRNTGNGLAQNVRVDSAQPEIVENEKGLLIDFELVGTQVRDQDIAPTLTANFGDIFPHTTATARFLLTSTLQGRFIDYTANFVHDNAIGNANISLIESVEIHELIRAVKADDGTDGIDSQFDFLTNDEADEQDLPDTLWLSDGTTEAVQVATGSTSGAPTPGDFSITLNLDGGEEGLSGWNYLRLPDPGQNDYRLVSVVRDDGKVIAVGDGGMAWTTDRTFPNDITGARRQHDIHLLDYDSTGTYTLTYVINDVVAPALVAVGPISPNLRNTSVDTVDVSFSEEIDLATFTVADLTLKRDGITVPLGGDVSIEQVNGATYRVLGLNTYTDIDGNYELIVNPADVIDFGGNAGVIGDNGASAQWAMSTAAPVAVEITAPAGLTNATPDSVFVTFSAALEPGSFGTDDLLLTRDGGANLIDAGVSVTEVEPAVYRIDGLANLTNVDGAYSLRILGSGVIDSIGNTGTGVLEASWTRDTVAPVAVDVDEPQSPRNIVVRDLDIAFSELLDLRNFTWEDLTLFRDTTPIGAPTGNLIDDRVSISRIDKAILGDFVYRISGINWPQGYEGTYTLTVLSPGVLDLAGNSLGADVATSWMLDLTRPEPATDLAITPDTGSSNTDFLTSATAFTLTGRVSEPGVRVRLTDKTLGRDLGFATVDPDTLTFSADLSFDTPGRHEIEIRIADFAANTARPDMIADIFIDTSAPRPQIEPILSPRPDALESAFVAFNEPVIGLDRADLALLRDGTPVPLGSDVSIVKLSDTRYRVDGLGAYTGDEGAYTLSVTAGGAADAAGNAAIAASGTFTVVADHPPVVNLVGDASTTEGASFAQTGTFTDPDEGDTWTATVDYGDATGEQPLALNADGTFTLSHTYADDGEYQVTVKVTDAAGVFGEESILVSVDNVAPVVAPVGNATVQTGTTFSAAGRFDDPGADTWTATVDYGDGSGAKPLTVNQSTRTFLLEHVYTNPGTYAVTVSVADDEGAVGQQTVMVDVELAGPAVESVVVNDGHAQRSMLRSLLLSFDEPAQLAEGAITLTRRDGGAGGATSVDFTLTDVNNDGRMWKLTFSGTGGSLPDGIYDLHVHSDLVSAADGSGRGMGEDYTLAFHRLYGDHDGNRSVDFDDFIALRGTFARSAGDPLFDDSFDADGNGTIDFADFIRFRANFGRSFDY